MTTIIQILIQVQPLNRLGDTAGRAIGIVFIVFLIVAILLATGSTSKKSK